MFRVTRSKKRKEKRWKPWYVLFSTLVSYSTSADTNNITDKKPKSLLLNKINFVAVSRRCKCIFSLSKEFAKRQTEQYFSLKRFMKSFKAFQKTEDDRGCSFITDFSMSVMYFTLDYREIILWCQVQIYIVIYVSLFILFFSIFTQRHRDRQEVVKETGPGAHYLMDSWPGLSWSSHWIRFKFKVDDIIFISRPFFFGKESKADYQICNSFSSQNKLYFAGLFKVFQEAQYGVQFNLFSQIYS